MNGVTANTAFEQMLTRGPFTFNPSAGDSLKRENKRTFTVADNCNTLMQMQKCDTEPAGPNYQYPIVGTIGINEVIRTFLTMALHEDLSHRPDDGRLQEYRRFADNGGIAQFHHDDQRGC